MADFLKNLRAFANGQINESALQVEDTEGYDFENDEEFIQECMTACLPQMIQMELMDESANELDEDVKEAFLKVRDYFVGQGLMSEAAMSINNPKVTFVRMSRQAQIKRLTSIISLKMARKDKIKAFSKYKLGQKIKKENMAIILQRYSSRAERIARKLVNSMKHGKPAAVVESKKKKK